MMTNKQFSEDVRALYLHIPFCSTICHYCDFYKMRAKPEVKVKYIDYLIKEMARWAPLHPLITTVYIGGGTPSALPLPLLQKLLSALHDYWDLSHVLEFTIEANPGDITADFLTLISKYHINRLSLGIQSFNENKLKLLGRQHTREEAILALKLCHQYQLENVNVDIIFGVPTESFSILKSDLQQAISHHAKHISLYALILEEKTVLAHWQAKGLFSEMSDDKQSKLYEKAQHYLSSQSYKQYEISNFCLDGYQSRHNLVYWNNEPYLALGASASYYLAQTRYTNPHHLERYFHGVDLLKMPFDEQIRLSKTEQMREHLMLGLRKITGINLKSFKERYHCDVLSMFPVINELISKKMLILKDNHLFIPQDKLFLSNEVLVRFF